MRVYVYRSSKKEGLYVYLREHDHLANLPEPVTRQLGTAEFAMEIELTAERKLGQENATQVLANLESMGFHLQMPRDIETMIENELIDKD